MKKIFLIIFLVLLLISISGKVIADTCTFNMCPNGERISSCCPQEGLVLCGTTCCSCQPCDLFVMLNNIIQFVFLKLIPPLAGLLIAIGGGMFLLAGGNPSTINQAKSLLMGVAIGLVIIYGSWLILGLFFDVIGVVQWVGWTEGGPFIVPCE